MANCAERLRRADSKKIFVKDDGRLPITETLTARQTCTQLHPGYCAERHAASYKWVTHVEGKVKRMVGKSDRGSFWCLYVESGLVENQFFDLNAYFEIASTLASPLKIRVAHYRLSSDGSKLEPQSRPPRRFTPSPTWGLRPVLQSSSLHLILHEMYLDRPRSVCLGKLLTSNLRGSPGMVEIVERLPAVPIFQVLSARTEQKVGTTEKKAKGAVAEKKKAQSGTKVGSTRLVKPKVPAHDGFYDDADFLHDGEPTTGQREQDEERDGGDSLTNEEARLTDMLEADRQASAEQQNDVEMEEDFFSLLRCPIPFLPPVTFPSGHRLITDFTPRLVPPLAFRPLHTRTPRVRE